MTTFGTSDAILAVTRWMSGTAPLVDDDPASAGAFADRLQLQGFDVRTGEHNQTARDQCR